MASSSSCAAALTPTTNPSSSIKSYPCHRTRLTIPAQFLGNSWIATFPSLRKPVPIFLGHESGFKKPPYLQKWRSKASFFPFLKKKKDSKALKEELLEAIAPLDRGAEATQEDQDRIDKIARELEAVNAIQEPLKSDLLNGKWELLYTTSSSILQKQRPKFLRPNGKIYQAINADTLRAQNMETWPYFNQIPIKAPGRGRGELEITYLDDELRVSRGDKGNLFILKMVDPSYRVPV
ncbi:probable plastid-lipid-associated protein 4, chloroplastic isoform X2 [Amborella trichopoda]|uniref:probable plastid-lipid-associated protein 4, chloroplastic isoform X2 n=1 Tax=Amborella trichopoda TaxID=13333 RepID=UPI0009BD0145|nr:probable plastid-lipid-associated protein 4, chloroplastic isoform X2 [Amborella trichopoda]|eukprot:XP_020528764.1 probable plastid-lipid-associated protein 4, chloroplastic isoform X2 [Amborella trichopoda]